MTDLNEQNVDQLSRAADEKRQNLNKTLNEVEQQLSPNHLVNQTMDYFREHGGDVASSIGQTVKQNPIPLVLTSVGIAWLMASQSRTQNQSHGQYERDYRDGYRYGYAGRPEADMRQEYADSDHHYRGYHSGGNPTRITDPSNSSDNTSMTDKMKGAMEDVADTAASLGDKAAETRDQWLGSAEEWRDEFSDHYTNIKSNAQQEAERFRYQARERASNVSEWMQEQPLVAGALGIAVGALLGSLLPASNLEQRMMGDKADEVTDRLRQQIAEGTEQAGKQVQQAASEAKDTATETLAELESENSRNEPGAQSDQAKSESEVSA